MKYNFLLNVSQFKWAREIIKLHIEENSAKLAPYHNTNHNFVVAENVWKAALYYGINPYNLICAALWHDFNHSQGKLPDAENVKIAIKRFMVWWYSTTDIDTPKGESPASIYPEINPAIVAHIITATEYDKGYKIPATDLSLEQQIIRDCDLLQYAEKNRFGQVYLGLSQEMNVPMLQLVRNAPTFINSIVPNTEWFASQWLHIKTEILEEFKVIEKILTEQ